MRMVLRAEDAAEYRRSGAVHRQRRRLHDQRRDRGKRLGKRALQIESRELQCPLKWAEQVTWVKGGRLVYERGTDEY